MTTSRRSRAKNCCKCLSLFEERLNEEANIGQRKNIGAASHAHACCEQTIWAPHERIRYIVVLFTKWALGHIVAGAGQTMSHVYQRWRTGNLTGSPTPGVPNIVCACFKIKQTWLTTDATDVRVDGKQENLYPRIPLVLIPVPVCMRYGKHTEGPTRCDITRTPAEEGEGRWFGMHN